jgi:sulfur carrier protein ThiS adenylyltransferase
MPEWSDIFQRNVAGMTRILKGACIGIAGCGGLGSNAAAILARAGLGTLILADNDAVEISNLNRQLFFLDDIGKPKVFALAARLKSINPYINLIENPCEITPENVKELFLRADILIEAFDLAERKRWLIESWCRAFPERAVICGNGVSGYGKTEELKVNRTGNIFFCGDGYSDMNLGLCSARVAIVAAMEANVAIELLIDRGSHD